MPCLVHRIHLPRNKESLSFVRNRGGFDLGHSGLIRTSMYTMPRVKKDSNPADSKELSFLRPVTNE